MLYVFYGNDVIKTRDKANALVQGLQAKHAETEIVRVTADSYESLNIEGLLATQGLFKNNYIIYLDNLGIIYETLSAEQYAQMNDSGHVCILVADKLSASTLRSIEGNTSKVIEYSSAKPVSNHNIFALANALKAKDKRRLWVELELGKHNGVGGEAAVGLLFWTIKDMLLKGGNNKWSKAELRSAIVELASLPHTARRDGGNIYHTIESWALSV